MNDKTPTRFSEAVYDALKEAGWFPGRNMEDVVAEWIEQLVHKGHFEIFPAAWDVLLEFGGLEIGQEGPGEECARGSMELDPLLAICRKDYFTWYSALVGERLFPLGFADSRNAILAIGESGRVFLIMERVWLIGEDFDDALERTIRGLKDLPLDLPGGEQQKMTADAMAEVMQTYAQKTVDLASEQFQTHLDFSEGSLEQVEAILARIYISLPKGLLSKLSRRGPSQNEIRRMGEAWGHYIGEVIRRRWGGEWRVEEDAPPTLDIVLQVSGKDIFPLAQAHKRLTNGPKDNIWHYYQALKRDLERIEREGSEAAHK